MDFPRYAKRFLTLVLVDCMLLPSAALANPAGGVVHGGIATITGQGTSTVNVDQRSQNAMLSWQSFNIQPGEVTNFHQPNAKSVAINRILDGQASQILGGLNANGHVYLINPNGILFGHDSVVNVGSLTAAASVKAGDLLVFGNGFDASATAAPGAKIENQGTIRTQEGGFVYLVAPQVENGKSGVIVAPDGQVMLAAGATVYLTDRADGLGVAVEYTAPGVAGDAAVNLGKIVADGGFVKMRADLVRQSGIIEANAVREQGGRIELVADSGLTLDDGSVTTATGGDGVGAGGTVVAKSGGDATVAAGSITDVSGGAEGGAGGSIEVSGERAVALSGTMRADGHGGASGGAVVIDPAELLITGTQTFQGASTVSLTATNTISLQDNATISLQNPSGKPTFDLRSGSDIVFGTNASITEGAGGSASSHWNVQLIAGAQDLTDPTSLALNPTSLGGIFLSGAKQQTTGPTTGRVIRTSAGEATPLTKNGLVQLVFSDLVARAATDVWVGNGGGLIDQVGSIDVQAGRDVRFSAGSKTTDGVIQNGSGNIRVVAGRSVILTGSAGAQGNAAIRTRGVRGVDAEGNPTQSDGGSVFVQALTGDVDAGIGNRWLQPGPLSTDPGFDVMPVVSQGILGIGTEVGGDVTVIAGRNVLTGGSTLARTGGSARLRDGTADYTGSHIGLFGRPVQPAARSNDSGPRVLDDPPESRLLVIAGGDISGDYVVRQGRAVFRAGYSLKPDAVATSLSADDLPALAASLQRSDLAADPTKGWFGSLSSPVTVDLMEGRARLDPAHPDQILQASIDALGANGIAIRAIENPSLVYPPNTQITGGTFRAPSYSSSDSAFLEAETGDVVLVGNDTVLPVEGVVGNGLVQNNLVWLLPPSLRVTTHEFQRDLESRGGDLVILNPFMLFPSSTGGLDLDVAGQVRGAGDSALGNPAFNLALTTFRTATLSTFTLPAATELLDPTTGLRFNLQGAVQFQPPVPSMPAMGSVVVRLSSAAANQSLLVPKGTRISDDHGRIFEVSSDTLIPDPSGRYSQGKVVFASDFTARNIVTIPQGTVLVDGNGVQFTTVSTAVLTPGLSGVAVAVQAVTPGHDAPAFGLTLKDPIAGIAAATNRVPTVRRPEGVVPVEAEFVGFEGLTLPHKLVGLVDPVPGVLGVYNTQTLSGTDVLPTGQMSTTNPSATSKLAGPVAEAAIGHSLVITNPSVLPPGVDASDISISLGSLRSNGGLQQPVVFRKLQVTRDSAGKITSTRVDPPADRVTLSSGTDIWTSRGAPGIRQSDAEPSFDARGGAAFDQYAQYYQQCRSGSDCAVQLNGQPIGVRGTGPTHLDDRTPARLRAGGFDGVSIDLAESVDLETDGDVHDLALRAQNNDPSDATLVRVGGDASFGGGSRTVIDDQTGAPIAVKVPDDPSTGILVSGPGSARVLVGVVEFAEADTNHDGFVSFDEFHGSQDVFDSLDTETALPDHRLSSKEAPYLPSAASADPDRHVGELKLPDVTQAGIAGGIGTVGNNIATSLPAQGASLTVVSANDLSLGSRGSIGTLEGGDLRVSSIAGAIRGGVPQQGTTDQRGIFTLYATPSSQTTRPAETNGGGDIAVDAYGDIDVGGLAIAALSVSSISLDSRAASIDAGVSSPFANPNVRFDPQANLLVASFEGGGIAAPGGKVDIKARKNIDIGAGISGAGITLSAGQNITSSGSGGVSSTGSVSISAQSFTGSVSAVGAVSVSANVTAGSSVSSSTGLVSGAGSVASNAGGTRSSADTNLASQQMAQSGSLSGTTLADAAGAGGPRQGVRIDVSSQPCKNRVTCQ